MAAYKVTSSNSLTRAWPYKIHIAGSIPTGMHQGIYDWLNKNNIKYQYNTGNWWYFKDEQDVMAFKLRWS